jgi:hypothetical protein
VEPDATLSFNREAAHNEVTVVGTAVRDFSKILLQPVQRVHGNTGRSKRFVIKNAAHHRDHRDNRCANER